MLRQRQFFMPILISVVALVLAACAPQTESQPVPATTRAPVTAAAPAATPTAAPAATKASPVAEGKAVYSAYCAACHGTEAQGTTVAGALPGHSADIIRRQVRAPMGKMPAFSALQIKDAQLEAMVAYIASLPAPENHVEPLQMDDAVAVHHWMTLTALKAGDKADALHHLGHITAMVTDHAHKKQAEEAKSLVAAGKLHDAEHEVEEMLAGNAAPKIGVTQLHLQLAFSAVSARDTGDVKHHMEHFMTVATGMEKVKGKEVINLIDMGDMHEAGHALEQMMGMKPHGE